MMHASSSQRDYFEELDFYSSASTGDPVDEWLSTPALTAVDDGLGWWTAMDKTGHPLARMSLNFLSAPGALLSSTMLMYSDLITCM
jgi:hypothetical protein